MPPRLFVDTPLREKPPRFDLPEAAARHAQVLRLQPGATVTLFDGRGGEWAARIEAMGAQRTVGVTLLEHHTVERELPLAVTLAVVMPAGERMDFLVEKATELGAAAIQPLMSERSVLRLAGERAQRRQAHWQALAIAACEQCGRNRVTAVAAPQPLATWLATLDTAPAAVSTARWLLGWRDAKPWTAAQACHAREGLLLSGPEGGFTEAEENAARERGFATLSLGPRVLRADTAPLAALAALGLTGA